MTKYKLCTAIVGAFISASGVAQADSQPPKSEAQHRDYDGSAENILREQKRIADMAPPISSADTVTVQTVPVAEPPAGDKTAAAIVPAK